MRKVSHQAALLAKQALLMVVGAIAWAILWLLRDGSSAYDWPILGGGARQGWNDRR